MSRSRSGSNRSRGGLTLRRTKTPAASAVCAPVAHAGHDEVVRRHAAVDEVPIGNVLHDGLVWDFAHADFVAAVADADGGDGPGTPARCGVGRTGILPLVTHKQPFDGRGVFGDVPSAHRVTASVRCWPYALKRNAMSTPHYGKRLQVIIVRLDEFRTFPSAVESVQDCFSTPCFRNDDRGDSQFGKRPHQENRSQRAIGSPWRAEWPWE